MVIVEDIHDEEGLDTVQSPIYPTYYKNLGFRNKADFLKWVEGKLVLDVLSGFGHLAKGLIIEGSTAKVISLDPSLSNQHRLEKIRENTKRYLMEYLKLDDPKSAEALMIKLDLDLTHDKRAIAGNLLPIPLPAGFVDRIICSGAIHWADFWECEKVMYQMCRVLKKGGEMRFPLQYLYDGKNHVAVNLDGKINAKFKRYLEGFGLTVIELSQWDKKRRTKAYRCLSVRKI